jgi:hypothetical protein
MVTSEKQKHHKTSSIKPYSLVDTTPFPLQGLVKTKKPTNPKNPSHRPKDTVGDHMGT